MMVCMPMPMIEYFHSAADLRLYSGPREYVATNVRTAVEAEDGTNAVFRAQIHAPGRLRAYRGTIFKKPDGRWAVEVDRGIRVPIDGVEMEPD